MYLQRKQIVCKNCRSCGSINKFSLVYLIAVILRGLVKLKRCGKLANLFSLSCLFLFCNVSDSLCPSHCLQKTGGQIIVKIHCKISKWGCQNSFVTRVKSEVYVALFRKSSGNFTITFKFLVIIWHKYYRSELTLQSSSVSEKFRAESDPEILSRLSQCLVTECLHSNTRRKFSLI